jgi:putative membrane protein
MKTADLLRTAAGDNGQAVRAGALAVLAVGTLVLGFVDVGPFAGQMIVHIASMNVAAPLLAVQLRRSSWVGVSGVLWTATIAQVGLLLALHTPAIHHAAHASSFLLVVLHVGALLVALAFWISVVNAMRPWQTMLALILSGKLACLLGALLIFAPRSLFAHHLASDVIVPDQQMAGLLMIAACPLSYVLPAVFITAQTILHLEKAPPLDGPRAHATAR